MSLSLEKQAPTNNMQLCNTTALFNFFFLEKGAQATDDRRQQIYIYIRGERKESNGRKERVEHSKIHHVDPRGRHRAKHTTPSRLLGAVVLSRVPYLATEEWRQAPQSQISFSCAPSCWWHGWTVWPQPGAHQQGGPVIYRDFGWKRQKWRGEGKSGARKAMGAPGKGKHPGTFMLLCTQVSCLPHTGHPQSSPNCNMDVCLSSVPSQGQGGFSHRTKMSHQLVSRQDTRMRKQSPRGAQVCWAQHGLEADQVSLVLRGTCYLHMEVEVG